MCARPLFFRRSGGVAIIVAVLVCFAGIAFAQSIVFPKLSGRIVDEAKLLDGRLRAEIDARLAEHEKKTTDQVVVVTLRSLSGHAIEDYGYQLGRHWQIGQKDKNNGVILIVAPNERRVRIEVGYGLEGVLPDAVANFIIQNSILPRFRANDFPGGIRRGVEDILQVLSGDAEEWKRRATVRSPSREADWTALIPLIIFGFILFLVIVSILNDISRGFGSNKRGKGFWETSRGGSYSSGGSSGGFSGGGGGFSGGGGSFGGVLSSGSW